MNRMMKTSRNAVSKINAKWHSRNIMSKNATLDQRVRWHVKHAEACGCRKMPTSMAAEIRRRRAIAKRAR